MDTKISTVPSKRMASERDAVIVEMQTKFKSLDEIYKELIDRDIYNPKTGKPYSRSAVYKAIQRSPRIFKSIFGEINPDEYRAKELAELQILKQDLYRTGQLKSVVKVIELESKLVGSQVHERELPVDLKILWDWVTEVTKKRLNPEQMLLSQTEHLKLDSSHVLELDEIENEILDDDAEYSDEIIEISENEFIS